MADCRCIHGISAPGVIRKKVEAVGPDGLDYPTTQVGVVGNITVLYDPSLGSQGLSLAQQFVNAVTDSYKDMETFFGVSGGPTTVVIAPLTGNNDGTGGAYHYGCDFTSGGVLYLDATFNNTTVNPLNLEVALYVAELSEAFMGTQNKGWGCGFSNGEALSRFLSEQETPAGTLLSIFVTGPSWDQAGRPDWISTTEQTDRDYVSIGCGIVYIYWMRSRGYNIQQICEAGGATLADNYQTLTGKTTAYADLIAALQGKTITSDNPFAASQSWRHNDLTAASGAPAATGNPYSYLFSAQGTQHVNYRGTDSHIHELWWNGSWHHNDLTAAAAGAPNASGDPSAYMFDSQGTQHVNYRGADNHIHELYWDGSWHHNDLTASTGAPNAAGNPHGYMFDSQGTQHVNYFGVDGHIHELWWNGSWHHNDLTAAAAGAPNAVGDPHGYIYTVQGTQHVNYRGTDNHIHELWWNGSWHHNDLTAAAAGAPNASGDPVGYMFDEQGTQHVNYRGTDNHIHELWWNGSWHHNDLTAAAAGAPNSEGNPSGYLFNPQVTQHVNYFGIDGHIHELWWNGSWHHNDLTAAAGAPNAASDPHGYMFDAQMTQHVNYRGTDSHVHELWWG